MSSVSFLTCSLLDNNELLASLSSEVYEFKSMSKAQVDESLFSASMERLRCKKRLIAEYVL